MSEMVEKVARAIYATDHNGACDHKVWENMKAHDRQIYLDNAAGAIEAMGEPSETMVDAGSGITILLNKTLGCIGREAFYKAHQAAIDAALEE